MNIGVYRFNLATSEALASVPSKWYISYKPLAYEKTHLGSPFHRVLTKYEHHFQPVYAKSNLYTPIFIDSGFDGL